MTAAITLHDIALNTSELLGVATAPAFEKTVYLRGFDKAGVYGDFAGATGYGMFPLPGSLLCFGDIDKPEDIDALLSLIPRLADGYRQDRGDHAAFAALMAYGVPNCSVDEQIGVDANGKPKFKERRSSRGPGLYQIGAGSRHPSGDVYRGNGKAPIELTPDETAIWAEFFGYKKLAPVSRVRENENFSHLPDDQTRAIENLYRIPPGCAYKDWIRAGRAVFGVFGDSGFSVWDQWSAGDADYPGQEGSKGTIHKWETFKRSEVLDGRVLTSIANEYDPAGKRRPSAAQDRQAAQVGTTVPASTSVDTAEPLRWSKGWRQFFYEYYGKQANNVCRVSRSLIEHYRGGGELDTPEFIKRSGLPKPTVYRVLNEYGIERLLFGAISSQSQNGHDLSHHVSVHSETTVSGSGKTLVSNAAAIDNAIRLVVIPQWNLKTKNPLPDVMLFETLGSSIKFIELDAILKRLLDAIPDRYKSSIAELEIEVKKWRAILSDPTPDDIEGVPDNYTVAIVEQHFSACEGKQQNWFRTAEAVGIPRATVKRIAEKEFRCEPIYSLPIEVDDPHDLPELVSIPGRGYPTTARTWDRDGVAHDMPYAPNRAKLRHAIEAGERVVVLPQIGFIPHRKTEEEKAAPLKPKISEPRVTRPRKPTLAEPTQRTYLGYSAAQARRIAIDICTALPDRVIVSGGEIVPFERLTNSELVQVMRGNLSEVIKVYTPKEDQEPIELNKRSTVDARDVMPATRQTKLSRENLDRQPSTEMPKIKAKDVNPPASLAQQRQAAAALTAFMQEFNA